jgi:hypothetical protein
MKEQAKEIVLGTVLFTLAGVLFYVTKLIFLATAVHATSNFFLSSFGTNELHIPDQDYRLVFFGLALIIVFIVFRRKLFAGEVRIETEVEQT